MKKKLSLKAKVGLSLLIIAATTGITIGSMFAYANNSDEVKGAVSPVNKNNFNNDYKRMYSEDGTLTPEIYILDPLKEAKVAGINKDATKFYFLDNPENKINFEDFFQAYFDKYQEGFVLEVKFGSFSFYDEYTAAVRPKQFIEFADWFIKNVAWGPDLLTLDSFRLVPGVEQHGNAITLGSHSTLHKEVSEIKFYPDAFFGSMPLYSISSGPGNASDAFGYQVFDTFQTKKVSDNFLKNIPLATAIKNSSALSNDGKILTPYLDVVLPGKLKDKSFLVYKNSDEKRELIGDNLILDKDLTADDFEKLKSKYPKAFANINFTDLQLAKVTGLNNYKATANATGLKIFFKNNEETEFSISLFENSISKLNWLSTETLAKECVKDVQNFLDFYDVSSYDDLDLYIYQDNGKYIYSSSMVGLINSIPNYEESMNENIAKYHIDKISVKDKNLILFLSKENGEKLVINYSAKEASTIKLNEFNNLKDALDYISINPISLESTAEDKLAKDENGKALSSLDSRTYQVYTEVYDGLYEKVTKKYPFILKNQNGPHIEKVLNDKGFYEYEIKDGPFKCLTPNDRLGLPLLLGATIDNFQGISTEFLRYVATHEYGHHYTLEKGQSLDDPVNGIIVGGISVNSGVSDTSYYSARALRNYLYARTNLDFERVDARGQKNPLGKIPNFIYKNTEGQEISETPNDIWGNADKNSSIYSVTNNKQRRFLQDFEGIVNASKLRKEKLGDLFISNSFDIYSGTINPGISGDAQAYFKNENGDLVFKNITNNEIFDLVKDGLGNKIPYHKEGNNIVFDFFETAGEGVDKVITKINVYKKDKKPFINIPLNTKLTNEDWAYINSQKSLINKSIRNLVVTHFDNNGWDTPSTFLGGPLNVTLKTYNSDTVPNSYVQDVTNRLNPIEIDPRENTIDGNRQSHHFLSVYSNDTIRNQFLIILSQYLNIYQRSAEPNFKIASDANINPILTFVNDNEQITNQFSFPIVNDSPFLNFLDDSEWWATKLLKKYNLPTPRPKVGTKGNLSKAILMTLFNNYTSDLNANGVNNNTLFSFMTPSGKVLDTEALSDLSSEINKKYSKVLFNAASEYVSNALNSIHGAIKSDNLVHYIFKNNEFNSIAFNSFEELFDFGSLDYSKAHKVFNQTDKSVVWNWDVDYVKTKFDLNTFKNGLLENETNNPDLQYIVSSEQNLANEIIKRFRHSALFLAIKNFSVSTELVNNAAIFSPDFGIKISDPEFSSNYVEDSHLLSIDNSTLFDIKKLQDFFVSYATKNFGAEYVNNLDTDDLFFLLGNYLKINDFGNVEGYPSQYRWSAFNTGTPSSDVINYNLSRVEPLLNDKFTDYIYTLPETLTRDYVQTTFIPNEKDFDDLPSFLSNANESFTALDFVVDGTKLDYWQNKKVSQSAINTAARAALLKDVFETFTQKRFEFIENNYAEIDNLKNELDQATNKLNDDTLTDEEKRIIQDKITELSQQIETENMAKLREKINKEFDNYETDLTRVNLWNTNDYRESSYFGELLGNSNGFFKDRFQKKVIGMELYDENRNSIQDDTIRLKDFEGNKITSRPKAFFVSQLLNYGVGTRNVAGLFRNKNLDAVALYGYIDLPIAKKIKYLKFTDVHSNEVKYLKVNTEKTNNVFYLEKQSDPNSKVTIEDLGYTTWLSDYALMAKYRDTLLQPKHQYYVEFVDANKEYVTDMTLGELSFLSENGKTSSQAPVKLIKQTKNNKEKVIINVDYQYNITG